MKAHVQTPEVLPCIQVLLLGKIRGKGITVIFTFGCRLCGISVLSSDSPPACESAAKSKHSSPVICKGSSVSKKGEPPASSGPPAPLADKKDADTLCICQKEHDTETPVVHKAVSSERHWKANLALHSFFILRWKDHWNQWLMIDHCYYLLWLTLRMWDLHLHLHDCNIPGCGAILGIGCKGIVLWDDMVAPCVFSSRLRKQILDLPIQPEYKWPFLLPHKPEQTPGCPSTVLEQFLNVGTCVHPCALACCLDRNHPFNTLEVEPPR